MKPSERNAIQSKIKATKNDVKRLTTSLARFEEGTLPHRKIKGDLTQAKELLIELETEFKNR